MRRADVDKVHSHPAEVYHQAVFKYNIRGPNGRAFQELRRARRKLSKPVGQTHAQFLNVLLLVPRPDHGGIIRKSHRSQIMLRVGVGGDHIKSFGIGQTASSFQHNGTVFLSQACVNNQHRL